MRRLILLLSLVAVVMAMVALSGGPALAAHLPTSKEDCKQGGFKEYSFRN